MPSQQYSAYNPDEADGPGPMGLLALVVAWAVPGLGHIMVGQKARGFVFMITIHALFAAGLLIGGIRAINPPDQAIWTYTQFLTGWPMLVANFEEKNWFEPIYVQPADPRDGAHRTPIRIQFEKEAADQNINLDDQSPEGLAKRQVFTENFIGRYPLFSYHPKVQDMGAVYCGIAGMLNLLVMFDVLLRVTGSIRDDPKKRRARLPIIDDGGHNMTLLAFIPLYDPLPALYPGMSEQWLWLVIPLVIAISIVYKCTRVTSIKTLPREAAIMTVELIAVMIFAGFILAAGYWAYLHYAGSLWQS